MTAELLAFAVGAHHGMFDCVDEDGNSGFVHRMEKEEIGYCESVENYLIHCADMEELTKRFQKANEELTCVYARIGNLVGEKDGEFAFYLGLLARLLLSAVIEGDRRDTAEFMAGISYPLEPEDLSAFWNRYLIQLEEKLEAFPQNSPIQQARRIISQSCRNFAENQGGIIRLNVPTGAGKTLSSLRYALAHARKWGKRRLIFTSPLLTILEQNAAVIREYLGDDSIILEHHSNVIATENAADLDMRELAVESWNSPVIITTLVQLLNTFFLGKTTAVRRFQSLCGSVIVIDEVQTVSSRMLSMFNQTINFLAEICGVTVVLCSATQPCLEKEEHPLNPCPMEMVPYDDAIWKPFRRTKILDGGTMTLEETVAFVRDSIEQVDSLLVVCNKKDEAVYLLQALDGTAEVCCHLSAAMCPAHRRETLRQLYYALETGESCLCIATQVIEAGVDISFQRVIRLAAGMDNVVQAAGRCNRNARQEEVPVYIVTLLGENLSRLEEIRRAKDATISLLTAYRQKPERFENDLTSDTAIAYYYNRLYGAMPQGAQEYYLPEKRVTLYSLLSDNVKYWDDNSPFYGRFMLNQAFRMAGDAFAVFDSDTQDVVVPYGEGKALIAELAAQNAPDVAFLLRWISQAKPYTVSLYNYQIRVLNSALTEYSGMLVLSPEYYDEKIGFTMKPGEFDFLEV